MCSGAEQAEEPEITRGEAFVHQPVQRHRCRDDVTAGQQVPQRIRRYQPALAPQAHRPKEQPRPVFFVCRRSCWSIAGERIPIAVGMVREQELVLGPQELGLEKPGIPESEMTPGSRVPVARSPTFETNLDLGWLEPLAITVGPPALEAAPDVEPPDHEVQVVFRRDGQLHVERGVAPLLRHGLLPPAEQIAADRHVLSREDIGEEEPPFLEIEWPHTTYRRVRRGTAGRCQMANVCLVQLALQRPASALERLVVRCMKRPLQSIDDLDAPAQKTAEQLQIRTTSPLL